MRAAMASAEVGDDVFGDDPTVNELQRQVATLLGKEAGLFIPSGTMGNLLATLVHCDARGGEMIVGDQSHIHFYEQGNSAQFGGVHSRVVRNQPDGTMHLADIEAAIRPLGDDHLPLTQLIVLEQTHNRAGGRILPVEYMDSVGALAKKHGLKYHVDGARLLNATVALGVDPARVVATADSICLCLSKGLAAPIGSVLVGTSDFIRRCRRLRKALGGGLRQVGILAAAGLLAVNEMVKFLAQDHAHAKQIAQGLATMNGFIVPPLETVQTNLLFVELDAKKFDCTAAQFTAELRTHGLLISPTDTYKIRFVTHYMIDDEKVQSAIEIVTKIAAMHVK
jgi:threonine aldolase